MYGHMQVYSRKPGPVLIMKIISQYNELYQNVLHRSVLTKIPITPTSAPVESTRPDTDLTQGNILPQNRRLNIDFDTPWLRCMSVTMAAYMLRQNRKILMI